MTSSVPIPRAGHIAGLFMDIDMAEEFCQSLIDKGYNKNDFSLVMLNCTYLRLIAREDSLFSRNDKNNPLSKVKDECTLAVAAADGICLFRNLEDIVIAGPIASTFIRTVLDGTKLGVIGELIGATTLIEELIQYEVGINDGGILLSVPPLKREDAEKYEAQCLARLDTVVALQD